MQGILMKNSDTGFVNSAAAERIKILHAQNWRQERSLATHEYENALLYPGSVPQEAGIYDDGRLLPSTRLDAWQNVSEILQNCNPDNCPCIEEPVIYIGVLYDCWGHCITDELKFLWVFLDESVLPLPFRGAKCVYAVSPRGRSLSRNFKALLEILGIPSERLIPVSSPTVLKSCCIPDECFYLDENRTARFYTKEYVDLIEFVCARVAKSVDRPCRKIYLTRTGWPKWEFGEIYIEQAFARAGYSIIRPEHLSFSDMVSLLQNADQVAATEGSCAHNSVFMRKGAQLTVIRKRDFDNLYQFAINKVRDLDCTYVDANCSLMFWDDRARNAGPFFMYCSSELARFLGVEKPFFPVLTFTRYILFCLFLKAVRFASPFWGWIKRKLGCPEFQLLKRL